MKKYIAAVSGGPDSMALLHKYKDHIIAVCSIDYNKRENSHLDNEIVKEFCNRHNIDFCLFKVQKNDYKKYSVNNFQSLARKIRYDFFIQIANEYNNFNLLIAHNKTDWLETAYMQHQKKSRALYYGIKDKTTYQNLNIYRPLIKYKKDTLKRYCEKHQIKYATDYTNELDIYSRNRIRKLINNWSFLQYNSFLINIHIYNCRNYWFNYKVEKYFKKWKKLNFNLSFFKYQKTKLQYYLIYNFLSLHNEQNNSSKKINNIIDFILNYKKDRKYRLENKRFISIENDTIKIKKEK